MVSVTSWGMNGLQNTVLLSFNIGGYCVRVRVWIRDSDDQSTLQMKARSSITDQWTLQMKASSSRSFDLILTRWRSSPKASARGHRVCPGSVWWSVDSWRTCPWLRSPARRWAGTGSWTSGWGGEGERGTSSQWLGVSQKNRGLGHKDASLFTWWTQNNNLQSTEEREDSKPILGWADTGLSWNLFSRYWLDLISLK